MKSNNLWVLLFLGFTWPLFPFFGNLNIRLFDWWTEFFQVSHGKTHAAGELRFAVFPAAHSCPVGLQDIGELLLRQPEVETNAHKLIAGNRLKILCFRWQRRPYESSHVLHSIKGCVA